MLAKQNTGFYDCYGYKSAWGRLCNILVTLPFLNLDIRWLSLKICWNVAILSEKSKKSRDINYIMALHVCWDLSGLFPIDFQHKKWHFEALTRDCLDNIEKSLIYSSENRYFVITFSRVEEAASKFHRSCVGPIRSFCENLGKIRAVYQSKKTLASLFFPKLGSLFFPLKIYNIYFWSTCTY